MSSVRSPARCSTWRRANVAGPLAAALPQPSRSAATPRSTECPIARVTRAWPIADRPGALRRRQELQADCNPVRACDVRRRYLETYLGTSPMPLTVLFFLAGALLLQWYDSTQS